MPLSFSASIRACPSLLLFVRVLRVRLTLYYWQLTSICCSKSLFHASRQKRSNAEHRCYRRSRQGMTSNLHPVFQTVRGRVRSKARRFMPCFPKGSIDAKALSLDAARRARRVCDVVPAAFATQRWLAGPRLPGGVRRA
eukprot:6193988-Pleurochrysis_carterae.AAC.1